MKPRSYSQQQNANVLLGKVVVYAVVALITFFGFILTDLRLLTHGKTVDATVNSCFTGYRRDHSTYSQCLYDFTVNGVQYEDGFENSENINGTKISITYLPGKPGTNMFTEDLKLSHFLPGMLFVLAVGGVISFGICRFLFTNPDLRFNEDRDTSPQINPITGL